ncbi:hypothetical protein CYMTET_42120 [Cymbomonas tetramitiformis]|uniref:Ribosomal RNA-processing protein 43 n=1 Tax=Cymbomonas tetramitiformis TaxID=36881 RepID=A0AAE0C4S0_9CHLO|nr:hypothetical protein CYMTET_42120 [Cymbomonas tetramitiformis]
MSTSHALDAEAYRKIYPAEFYKKFLDEKVRPDGRPLGRCRATSVAAGAVSKADGSALVKIGNTTMIAGVKLEIMRPTDDASDVGTVEVTVEMPPLCSASVRSGRPTEEAQSASQRISEVLTHPAVFDLTQLCIAKGQAAWVAYLDIFCLDADGNIFDAALLAAVAALSDVTLPAVTVLEDGRVTADTAAVAEAQANAKDAMQTGEENAKGTQILTSQRQLSLKCVPIGLTCGLNQGHLIADPCAEESGLLDTTITVILNESGELVSVYKPGGNVGASDAILMDCIEMSRLRYKEVSPLLEKVLGKGMSE